MKNIYINFGGACGHYSYLLGIAKILQDNFNLNEENIKFSGISSGCFPALCLCLNIDIDDMYNNVNIKTLNTIQQYNSKAFFNFSPTLKDNTLFYINNIGLDLYKNANNKLLCTLTHVPTFKSNYYYDYNSNEDLIDCIMASGHFPIYSSKLFYTFRNKYYIDGVISKYTSNNNIRTINGINIDISCDMFRKIDTSHLFISSCTNYSNSLYNLGKKDALDNIEYFANIIVNNNYP